MWCVMALLASSLGAASVARATPAQARATSAESDAADLLVRKVNAERTKRGLKALTVSPGLTKVAQRWSERQSAESEMSHNPKTASQIPAGWRRWGENVAWASGYASNAAAIHTGWMNSTHHRDNILLASYTSIGIGYAVDRDGRAYATQVFATYPASVRARVSSLSKSRGSVRGGTVITIRGRNLGRVTKVVFGSTRAAIVSRSSKRLTVRVPAHSAGKVHVRVRTAIGWSAKVSGDTYRYRR